MNKDYFKQTIKHRGQPSLSQVVTNCDKRTIGTSGGFGYRSQIEENDISIDGFYDISTLGLPSS